jgi:uncharacterized protein YjbJ (UPF0337 family)
MDEDRIAGSAKEFAGRTEAGIGDVTGEVRTQAAGRARDAVGTAQNLYGQAKDAARRATDAATGYVKDTYDHRGDTFRDGSQALAQKVQEKPLGSLVIACAVGFALGLFVTRPPRRRQRGWRYYR